MPSGPTRASFIGHRRRRNAHRVQHATHDAPWPKRFTARTRKPALPHAVFFKRAVLEKYYSEPDGLAVTGWYLAASPRWGLPIDNALGEHVAVSFLGDLSRIHDRERLLEVLHVGHAGRDDAMSRYGVIARRVRGGDASRSAFPRLLTAAKLGGTLRFGWHCSRTATAGDEQVARALPTCQRKRGYAAFGTQLISLEKIWRRPSTRKIWART